MKRCQTLLLVILTALHLHPAQAEGLSPTEAAKKMDVLKDFSVKLFANEPDIRQPVAMQFDERGRLWVLQYLQYPNPAGLKVLQVDEYLRTVYDKVPEPPPKGPKGADRITICEDTNGDGKADKFKDFTGGLNLASGFAIGHGGVYVAQPPYLLFYPDKNHDDIPDGDPEVLLSGFGMEDAHAFPNSLQWGPDGWLYGAQGSTVTARIRGIEFQQGIWRYHPLTKEFELFCEGGGNTWGLDFDEHGNIIAGTNYEKAGLHQVQGAYYIKNFGKHGALHNPHTYGFFDHIPEKNFRGGHVTCGGIVYQGGAYPPQFNGAYLAGNLLSSVVFWHTFKNDGSSFTMNLEGEFATANDPWFRPVDTLVGPDGSLYIADWYDKRATHVDPRDTWDRSNGRVYKIEYKGTPQPRPFDLRKMPSRELLVLLQHPNNWYRRETRRILAERRDASVIPALQQTLFEKRDGHALESFWALTVSGGFDGALAAKTLAHTNADVRAWTIRLLGDTKAVTPQLSAKLVDLAQKEPSATVRNQLACTAKRLPGKDALPLLRELLHRDSDESDPQIPLLLWWAVENKALTDREQVLGLVNSLADWNAPIIRKYIIERLGRRYAAEGTDDDYATCAKLLAMAPGTQEANLLIQGMEKAFEGRKLDKVPAPLEKALADLLKNAPGNATVVRFALRLGNSSAQASALEIVANAKAPEADRVALIEALGQVGQPECLPVLLKQLQSASTARIRVATLAALQRFAGPEVPAAVLEQYPRFTTDLKTRARTLLVGRPAWALELLKAVEAGKLETKEIAPDQLRRIANFKDTQLDQLVTKHWGRIQPPSSGEKLALVRGLVSVLKQAKGDPKAGKEVFTKTCGICHTLFNEGNHIGPELTGADRRNTQFMLENIVDPNAIIRAEFINHNAELKDERVLTGLLSDSTPQTITILDASNQKTTVPRDQVKSLTASAISMMPEGLLDNLKPQEVRDLFSYLQSEPGTKGVKP